MKSILTTEVVLFVFCFCRNSTGVPIFEKPPPKYSAQQIMHILLDPSIDERRIATRRPLDAPSSSTFVVDISKLSHPDDIKKDMYGKWLHSGSHSDVFLCTYEDDDVRIEKAASGASGRNVFYLRTVFIPVTLHSGGCWHFYLVG